MYTRVKAELIDLAAPFAARASEPHAYLHGIAIQPCAAGGAFIVASDGHRIAVFRDPEGEASHPIIVPVSKAVTQACRPRKADDGVRRFVVAEGAGGASAAVYMTAGDGVIVGDPETSGYDDDSPGPTQLLAGESAQLVNERYPDWRRVFPARIAWHPARPAVNPRYLAEFCRVARSTPGFPWIRCYPGETDTAPVVVRCKRDDFVGLLMPMAGCGDEALPDWIGIEPVADEEADTAADTADAEA